LLLQRGQRRAGSPSPGSTSDTSPSPCTVSGSQYNRFQPKRSPRQRPVPTNRGTPVSEEEAQFVTTRFRIVLVVSGGYVLVYGGAGLAERDLGEVLSFVPPLTATLMPARIALLGHVAAWEIPAQAVIISLRIYVAARSHVSGLARGGPRSASLQAASGSSSVRTATRRRLDRAAAAGPCESSRLRGRATGRYRVRVTEADLSCRGRGTPSTRSAASARCAVTFWRRLRDWAGRCHRGARASRFRTTGLAGVSRGRRHTRSSISRRCWRASAARDLVGAASRTRRQVV
jgi:hypothetical protein